MSGRLAGKAAIITGGAGGIGAATGMLFCEQGARVVLVDSEAGAMQAALSAIRAAVPDAEVVPVVADVGREETAAHVVTEATKAFGELDVLVNLAGIRAYEPLAEAKAATWDALLKVNLLSYAYLIRESLGALRACGRGSIVNVASTHAVNPRAGMGQYDVTKAGIVSLTKTLAFEEARHGIRVNAVCPGATLTPFHLRRAAAAGESRDDVERKAASMCLLGRWADPREVAWPILWLASDEASYVTGSVLMVDGGQFTK
ncbi:MAG TPA: SDR family NAD(P)-dependent oxidoreductase [Xanthobacteraceae bacterium]|nr:SDR family NAD(P)-dependent oxidoreductase [Xanthobacteraceae bacterium]